MRQELLTFRDHLQSDAESGDDNKMKVGGLDRLSWFKLLIWPEHPSISQGEESCPVRFFVRSFVRHL